jgi:hypothetical protein
MKKITYENISDLLLHKFPEYKNSENYEPENTDLNYVVFGNFAQFLLARIAEYPETDELIQRVFGFINDIYNRTDIESSSGEDTVQNLLYIELFENLAQTKQGVALARKYLKERAKDEFETVFRYTGVEEYEPSEKNEAIVSKWRIDRGKKETG